MNGKLEKIKENFKEDQLVSRKQLKVCDVTFEDLHEQACFILHGIRRCIRRVVMSTEVTRPLQSGCQAGVARRRRRSLNQPTAFLIVAHQPVRKFFIFPSIALNVCVAV